MPNSQITATAKNYPKRHLALAVILSSFFVLVLMLLPSPEASAKRTIIQVDAPIEPINLSRAATTPTNTVNSAPSNTAKEPKRPNWLSITVKDGDTLSHIFKRAGLSARDVHEVTHSGQAAKSLKHLKPGQKFQFDINNQHALTQLNYIESRLENTLFSRMDNGFSAQKTVQTLQPFTTYAEGVIESSLFLAAEKAGLSQSIIMELANVFGWDVDFSLDIRKGDRFRVVYEELYLNGEKIKNGDILSAQFINQGKTFTAIRYETSDRGSDYFTPDGESMRKAFLRSPISFARISSHFNLKRKHPVLHTIRAHKGTDYAASRGTPIKSTGDGKIIFAGRKGGYGRTVIVQHGQRYRTLYAHMKNYGKGMRSGKRVKQGQVIGYVGSSGLATGPHLHYEFYVNGSVRNPVTVKLPHANPISKRDKKAFFAVSNMMMSKLAIYAGDKKQTLASTE